MRSEDQLRFLFFFFLKRLDKTRALLMVLFKESSLLFIMTEEISGAYKLVIYLSQTSLLFGRLPVVCAAADKDISGGRSRGRNAL